MTVSDVPGGVCKELYATFEIAKITSKQTSFPLPCSQRAKPYLWRVKICEESLRVIALWFFTGIESIHKFLYRFIAAYSLQPSVCKA